MKNRMMHRITCVVADSCGIGDAHDASQYGDNGSNTLANTAKAIGGLGLPTFEKLGLGCLGEFKGISGTENPLAIVKRLVEKSAGKDTTTGHWELMGLVTENPFAVFPRGFSDELIRHFVMESGIGGILGNKTASGTVIIEELGEQHIRTGFPIVYTSADSVFQIAAHEKYFGLERLYEICEIARRITLSLNISRVIARPFVGESGKSFKRTQNRHDYSLVPPGKTCLDLLSERGVAVCSVGKIEDIFVNRGVTERNHTGNNAEGLLATLEFMKKYRGKRAFVFANLSDFDTLYGHRRNPEGYADCLRELDSFLPKLMAELTVNDGLIITADHGCDPTFKGTDHTRENVPVIAYFPSLKGRVIVENGWFSDVAISVLEAFGISAEELPGGSKGSPKNNFPFWPAYRG